MSRPPRPAAPPDTTHTDTAQTDTTQTDKTHTDTAQTDTADHPRATSAERHWDRGKEPEVTGTEETTS
jgi:hypothetical protein